MDDNTERETEMDNTTCMVHDGCDGKLPTCIAAMRPVILTNAPDAYDYGYAVPMTGAELPVDPTGRVTLRAVTIDSNDPAYHAQYQSDRYRSGLYVAIVGLDLADAVAQAKRFLP